MHHFHVHTVVVSSAVALALLAGRPLGDPSGVGRPSLIPDCDRALAAVIADRAGAQEGDVDAFYGIAPQALWSRGGRPTAAAGDALELVGRADRHGLDPARYDLDALREHARQLDSAGGCDLEELAELDLALSGAVAGFLTDVHQGLTAPAGVHLPAHDDLTPARLAELIRTAAATGRAGALDADLEPGFAQYRYLKRALADLPPPGERSSDDAAMAGRLAVALERLRWLPHAPDGPLIVANIPAFRLVAFRSGRDATPAIQMRIVVGRASRTRTPVFVGAVSEVMFHPPWYPPASIVRNEVLPAQARDAGFLERAHLDVVSSEGAIRPATAENLALVRAGTLRLRQLPGPENPLGRVKFVFPNDYRVYMHDTPARELFGRPRRDFSHGCIRLQDAPALAAFVLAGVPGFSGEGVEAALRGTRTRTVAVSPEIPVYIAYTTTIARPDGTVELFEDVYGLDAGVRRALDPSGEVN